MRTALLVFLSAWTAGAVQALEVSLEENKAQRGSIGYIDMQKVFRLYPETQKAKQNFEEVLRQAEDQVNLRKAELIGMRAEIIRLRMERDAAAKLAEGIKAAPAQPEPLPKAVTASSETASPAAVDVSTAAAENAVLNALLAGTTTAVETSTTAETSTATAVGTSTETSVASGSAAKAAEPEAGAPLIINLPGLSPEPIVVQPPRAALEAAASLPEIEAKLSERSKALLDKEAEFKTYQAQVEKNLLELEDKKTEILLGKIYRAVQEVAREEGVSVVVDRSQILFGHQAMDLTDKVIKKLKT